MNRCTDNITRRANDDRDDRDIEDREPIRYRRWRHEYGDTALRVEQGHLFIQGTGTFNADAAEEVARWILEVLPEMKLSPEERLAKRLGGDCDGGEG